MGRVSVQAERTGRADHRLAISATGLDKLSVLACRAGPQSTLVIEEDSERYVLWIPLSGPVDITDGQGSGVQTIGRGWIGIVPAVARTRVAFGPSSRCLGVVVPQSALLDGIEAVAGGPVNGHVAFDDDRFSVQSPTGEVILGLLQLLEAASAVDGLTQPAMAFARQLESMMVLSMVSGLPHNFMERAAGGARTAAPAIVALAEAYMQKNLAEPIDLQCLAAATGYGSRTIQLAFRQFRNTTPMSHLRRLRLDRIYQDLMNPAGETTVAGVARAWQFPNTGRMSRRFQQIYGETPQQVLRRGCRSTKR